MSEAQAAQAAAETSQNLTLPTATSQPAQAAGAQGQAPESQRIESLPDWAQAIIRTLRGENAERRVSEQAARASAEQAEQLRATYEQTQAKLVALQAELRQERIAAARQQAKTKYSLPDAIAERLRGETSEEILADAAEVAQAMPTRAMPNDAAAGRTSATVVDDPRISKRATGQYSGI
jgi:hypothetical protein